MKKSLGATTLAWPTPVYLVCSYDSKGNPNVMNAAWGGICASDPPCIAVSVRPSRHTYEGITQNKAFSICIPSAKLVAEADFVGMASGSKLNKFSQAQLTASACEMVNAPYIEECPLVIELSLVRSIELGSHVQFIGEVKDVKADEACLNKEGKPDISLANPILFDPALRNYHRIGPVEAKAFDVGKALLNKENI